MTYFRGSELQNYFTKILEDNLKAVSKPQYVDQIPKVVSGYVKNLLNRKDDRGNQDEILEILDLKSLVDRQVSELSGGELQRFACAMVCVQKADIYMFDEPSSYLDVKQRLNAAITIRNLLDVGPALALTLLPHRKQTMLLRLNTICLSLITCQTSYVAFMVSPEPMVLLPCPSPFVRVSISSLMVWFQLKIYGFATLL